MITLIILISIYILSAIIFWLWVHFDRDDTTMEDVFMMFVPVVNTFLSIYLWIVMNPFKSNGNANKFFKIK